MSGALSSVAARTTRKCANGWRRLRQFQDLWALRWAEPIFGSRWWAGWPRKLRGKTPSPKWLAPTARFGTFSKKRMPRRLTRREGEPLLKRYKASGSRNREQRRRHLCNSEWSVLEEWEQTWFGGYS